jgi:alanine racemase
MPRPTVIQVHLDRLLNNFALAKRLHGGRLLAVIKGNAYGHGDIVCARALAQVADGFAVATMEEGVRLRDAGIPKPIVLLGGIFEPADWQEVVRHRFLPVVHHRWQIETLAQFPLDAPIPVWMKVDTGMHRLGFQPEDFPAAWADLKATNRVSEITVMTHFANADGTRADALDEPVRRFSQAMRGIEASTSLCNSGTILGYPQTRGDWGRPGLMLYGVDPGVPGCTPRQSLQPVMTLRSAITAVRDIAVGESVGYGSIFTAQRPTRVGVIPCGYADGYPRSAAQGTPVAMDGGVVAPLIGRVSMDMITVDLTDLPQAGIGSTVELWGSEVPVATVAHNAGTVAYEVLCNAKRAPVEIIAASCPHAASQNPSIVPGPGMAAGR